MIPASNYKTNERKIDSILVASGDGESVESKKIEVLDLKNPENICSDLPELPKAINGAVGGLVKNQYPIICGGWIEDEVQKDCYIIGEKDSVRICQKLSFTFEK